MKACKPNVISMHSQATAAPNAMPPKTQGSGSSSPARPTKHVDRDQRQAADRNNKRQSPCRAHARRPLHFEDLPGSIENVADFDARGPQRVVRVGAARRYRSGRCRVGIVRGVRKAWALSAGDDIALAANSGIFTMVPHSGHLASLPEVPSGVRSNRWQWVQRNSMAMTKGPHKPAHMTRATPAHRARIPQPGIQPKAQLRLGVRATTC